MWGFIFIHSSSISAESYISVSMILLYVSFGLLGFLFSGGVQFTAFLVMFSLSSLNKWAIFFFFLVLMSAKLLFYLLRVIFLDLSALISKIPMLHFSFYWIPWKSLLVLYMVRTYIPKYYYSCLLFCWTLWFKICKELIHLPSSKVTWNTIIWASQTVNEG